jgi:beta-lactamase class A
VEQVHAARLGDPNGSSGRPGVLIPQENVEVTMERARLQADIEQITAKVVGRMGVCVRDLASGQELGVCMDEPLPMASVCKVPVLVTAFRASDAGRLDLAERVEFTDACRCFGSGLFNAFDPGIHPTVRDLLLMMIVVSDNAATDLVVDRLTPEGVTACMRDLGFRDIRVDRPIRELIGDIHAALDPRCQGVSFADWEELRERNPELKAKTEDLDSCREAVNEAAADRDVATAREMAGLCAQIALKQCASEASCEAMLDILNKQQLNGRLPRDLPAFTKFPHKTGTLGSGAVVNDAGVLFLDGDPVAAVAVLSRDVRDPIHETNAAIAGIGRAVYEHYRPLGRHTTGPGLDK